MSVAHKSFFKADADACKDEFIKTGMWPNEVMWQLWCKAWDARGRQIAASEVHAFNESETLTKIHQWCEAYPLDVFPEPDFAAARRGLASVGIDIGAVSASNMRHVLTGIRQIVDDAAPPPATPAA